MVAKGSVCPDNPQMPEFFSRQETQKTEGTGLSTFQLPLQIQSKALSLESDSSLFLPLCLYPLCPELFLSLIGKAQNSENHCHGRQNKGILSKYKKTERRRADTEKRRSVSLPLFPLNLQKLQQTEPSGKIKSFRIKCNQVSCQSAKNTSAHPVSTDYEKLNSEINPFPSSSDGICSLQTTEKVSSVREKIKYARNRFKPPYFPAWKSHKTGGGH